MSLIEKLDGVLAVIAAFDAWSCEGDTVRCADGNGCECEMAGKDCPPVYDAMNALLRDHGPAIRQAMIDAERWRKARKELLWAPSYDGTVRWSIELKMPEPDMSNPGASLDAAIDKARATGEGEGNG